MAEVWRCKVCTLWHHSGDPSAKCPYRVPRTGSPDGIKEEHVYAQDQLASGRGECRNLLRRLWTFAEEMDCVVTRRLSKVHGHWRGPSVSWVYLWEAELPSDTSAPRLGFGSSEISALRDLLQQVGGLAAESLALTQPKPFCIAPLPKQYTCNRCKKVFSSAQRLLSHVGTPKCHLYFCSCGLIMHDLRDWRRDHRSQGHRLVPVPQPSKCDAPKEARQDIAPAPHQGEHNPILAEFEYRLDDLADKDPDLRGVYGVLRRLHQFIPEPYIPRVITRRISRYGWRGPDIMDWEALWEAELFDGFIPVLGFGPSALEALKDLYEQASMPVKERREPRRRLDHSLDSKISDTRIEKRHRYWFTRPSLPEPLFDALNLLRPFVSEPRLYVDTRQTSFRGFPSKWEAELWHGATLVTSNGLSEVSALENLYITMETQSDACSPSQDTA